MKLWHLTAIDGHRAFNPWYDKCFGAVVRAETESQARELLFSKRKNSWGEDPKVWLCSNITNCEELGDGPAGVIVADVWEA